MISQRFPIDMKQKSARQPIWLPLAIAAAVVVGIIIGSRFQSGKPVADNDRKLNAILNLIAQDYVDTTNLKDLIEMSIPEILSNLDPHTTYFSAEDLQAATDELNGSFSGIGISFMLMNDTIVTTDDVTNYLGVSVLASVPTRAETSEEEKNEKNFGQSRKKRRKRGLPFNQ